MARKRMPKWKKIVLIVMAVWFLIFLIDFFASVFLQRPLIAIKITTDEAVTYYGLGYSFKSLYNHVSPEGNAYDSYSIYNPWFYFLLNFVLLMAVIFVRKRKDKKAGEIAAEAPPETEGKKKKKTK